MFQPAYTMDGVELHRLKMQHRILRILTTNLSFLQLTFQTIVQQAISCEISKQKTLNGTICSNSSEFRKQAQNSDFTDWTILQTFPMIKNVVGKVNIFTFYGQDYSKSTWKKNHIKDWSFLKSMIPNFLHQLYNIRKMLLLRQKFYVVHLDLWPGTL